MKISELRNNRILFFSMFTIGGIISLLLILAGHITPGLIAWIIPVSAKLFFKNNPDEREKIMYYHALANSPFLLVVFILFTIKYVKDPDPRIWAIFAVFLIWMGGTNLYVILKDRWA